MNETTVFLCLGSNRGNRRSQIDGGIAELQRGPVSMLAHSSVYETEPVGLEEQPWFFNQVVHGTTRLDPERLLGECKRIERLFGRGPTDVRFGPRTLDIDILLYGDRIMATDWLTIPHPRMHERRFVLIPLVEIAPRLVDPRSGREYSEILERLDEGKKVSKSLRNES
jgi:2-amino-4-hydroxy-6-hydroxymethyldihydropteridine diphosphokinase